MKKLLKSKKGFTLVEMLIVVAIIVILVAISFPTFSANLSEAAESADAANMRGARAAVLLYMIENDITSTGVYYDAVNGVIDTNKPSEGYGQSNENKGKVIMISRDGESNALEYEWEEVE